MNFAFPKPRDQERIPGADPFIRTCQDGRQVIDRSARGNREYRRRVEEMRVRQKYMCCLFGYAPMCTGALRVAAATFEHERSRGGGKRDDRVSLPDGTWINGAAHLACNNWKGSRYIDYNRGFRNG
jgi:hypothetical protein